jgi:predicted LPLAT superfamily acyltransferase
MPGFRVTWATQMLKGMMERSRLHAPYRWVEGYDFFSEEEAEEILAEIMHDKYTGK